MVKSLRGCEACHACPCHGSQSWLLRGSRRRRHQHQAASSQVASASMWALSGFPIRLAWPSLAILGSWGADLALAGSENKLRRDSHLSPISLAPGPSTPSSSLQARLWLSTAHTAARLISESGNVSTHLQARRCTRTQPVERQSQTRILNAGEVQSDCSSGCFFLAFWTAGSGFCAESSLPYRMQKTAQNSDPKNRSSARSISLQHMHVLYVIPTEHAPPATLVSSNQHSG